MRTFLRLLTKVAGEAAEARIFLSGILNRIAKQDKIAFVFSGAPRTTLQPLLEVAAEEINGNLAKQAVRVITSRDYKPGTV